MLSPNMAVFFWVRHTIHCDVASFFQNSECNFEPRSQMSAKYFTSTLTSRLVFEISGPISPSLYRGP